MTIRYIPILITLFISLLCCANAQSTPPPTATTPIKIGAIYSLNDHLGALEQQSYKGANVAVDWVNAHGGVNGHSIQLVIEGTNANTDITTQTTAKLAKNPAIHIIIGDTGDRQLAAIMIAVKQYDKLLIAASTTSGRLTAAYGRNLILACFDDTMQSEAAAMFAAKTLHAKNALLITNTEGRYELNVSHGFQQKFNALGDHIVANVKYRSNTNDRLTTEDMTDLIKQARHHRHDNDVIYLAVPADEQHTEVAIIAALRQAGFTQPIIGGDALDSASVVTAPSVTNVYFTAHSVINPVTATGLQREFIDLYQQKYNSLPQGAFAAQGFDAVLLAVQALSQAKQDNTNALRNVIFNLNNFPGVSGLFSFNHNNIPSRNIYIVKVVNHQRQLVQTISGIKPLFYP